LQGPCQTCEAGHHAAREARKVESIARKVASIARKVESIARKVEDTARIVESIARIMESIAWQAESIPRKAASVAGIVASIGWNAAGSARKAGSIVWNAASSARKVLPPRCPVRSILESVLGVPGSVLDRGHFSFRQNGNPRPSTTSALAYVMQGGLRSQCSVTGLDVAEGHRDLQK